MDRKDNIYIYVWEELNTIYIGRTVNPKGRHSQHKTRESEKTYQFSSEHGVKHPPMIIIENDLTTEEGIEREKYWIKHYRDNGEYNVLNKSCGGETGLFSEYNEEKRKEWQRKYYQNNKEKILEQGKKYRKEHKKELNEKDKIRYYKNKTPYIPLSEEEKKIRRKEYYQKNKEKILAKNKEYKKNNREKILRYKKKYREKHKKLKIN
jgi:hypothetical protein